MEKKIDVDELKKIQIEILDIAAEFCERNDIKYWINCGTLLGAVRHKGYIPWDDDIDLGMLREDYDRFIKLFNESNNRYRAYCFENNPNFYYGYCKVLDTNTVLYEPDRKGNKLSANIDIFVYDNAPKGKFKVKLSFLKRTIYLKCYQVKLLYTENYNIIKKMMVYFLYVLLLPFSKKFFITKIVKNGKKYVDKENDYVADLCGFDNILFEKELFKSFTTLKFEGKEYKVPSNYDKFLHVMYGDYMKLPPEEERVSHHRFEAYYKN